MPAVFAGSTAEAYRLFRRDVPHAVLDRLLGHLGSTAADRAIDLGAGTGQVAVGLAARLGGVLALDPEPDMLVQLRRRIEDERLTNLLCVLGGDRDLPAVASSAGGDTFGLLTVANALHWMDATAVFASASSLLRPGGGLAVITHGRPLWLGERDWNIALRAYLEDWFGPVRGSCGTDTATQQERRGSLVDAGFVEVTVLEHHATESVSIEYVIGHLYSALSATQVAPDRRAAFETGLRNCLHPYSAGGTTADLPEDVPVHVLVGQRP